jgi:cytochrome c553
MQTGRPWKLALLFLLAPWFVTGAAAQTPQAARTRPNGLPPWAYNIPDKVQPPFARPKGAVRVPSSSQVYDAARTASSTHPPDWFPNEHPAAPRIVTNGPGAKIPACGSCHLMSGQGHPESADIAALPVAYFARQMDDFKSGARKDDGRMQAYARAASAEDVREAAEYFAAIQPIPFVKVIETSRPPRTYVSALARHRLLSPQGGTEPIGHRIIEIPDNPLRTLDRDPHSGFIAYVPPGSIARGEALVKTGGSGKTVPCAMCHGEKLQGAGNVPRIAGLQPAYIARQLITMQNGSRAGAGAELMKASVAHLSEDDIIAISAYLGSLPPR